MPALNLKEIEVRGANMEVLEQLWTDTLHTTPLHPPDHPNT